MYVDFPPGPTIPPYLQTLRWFYRPIPFMQQARRQYGETFSVTFIRFERPMVLFSDPAAIKELYINPAHTLPPGRELLLEPVMGPRSILLLEGSDHLSRRKLMLPPFHGERMRAYEDVMEEVIHAEVDSWRIGESFPIHTRMQAVTLEIILRAVFGVTDPERLVKLRQVLGRVLEKTASPGLQLLGLTTRNLKRGPWAQFQAMLREVDVVLHQEIAERRNDPTLAEREDILSLMLMARFEDGAPMSDDELRDQLMTLLLAGHETTATALAWTFDLLLRHPQVLGRLREELIDGGEEYLRAVIAEGLRIRPVIPLAGRRLTSELEVDGIVLEPGTDATPCIWMTHTRADIYRDPFAYRPERFLGEAPDTYAWIPFGGGVRRCLGAAFAEFEMKVVLREVVGRCALEGVDPNPQRIARRNITLSPRDGTPVVVRSRRDSAVGAPAPA